MYNLSDWRISDDGVSEEDILQNGNRLLTGNGYLGYRGTVSEADLSWMPAVIVSGLYDKHGDLWREPVNAPDPLFTEIFVDGKALSVMGENVTTHKQALDFRYGVYSRETSWTVGGASVSVKAERFIDMKDVHRLCMKYSVSMDAPSTDAPISIKLKQGIRSAVHDLNGPHLGNFQFDSTPLASSDLANRSRCFFAVDTKTLEKNIPLSVACSIDVPSDVSYETEKSDDGIFHIYTINADKGKTFDFFVYGAIYSAADTEGNCGKKARENISASLADGWDTILISHKNKWDDIWRTGDVLIEGDEYAQRALRYSLYHLHIIAPRHANNLSIPARGLSGQTYKGAIFWDTEMFIAPYFLCTEPELAASFIRYRIETLAGAKRKAAEYGYRGAFYAWESQESGDDACTHFNVTDVFTGRPVRTYFRDKQIHISADIVYSIRKYIDVTGNAKILSEGAMEVMLECARFFLSYLYYSPERDRYELLDVTGPDEYHERVNNNAFTNKIVFSVFETVQDCVDQFFKTDKTFIEELFIKLDFEKDFALMHEVMKKFYLPKPNENNIIEQFDHYFKQEDCSIETVKSRLCDQREYWGGANGVAGNTQIIKQADVVTMLVLFGNEYSDEVKRANLAFYEPRTEHGSSLSNCMYALLSCAAGNSEWAYPFFVKTAEIDISGKSKQFAGGIYIGGTHPAANGGAWMTAVQGFCGFSIDEGKIICKPRLPEKWKKVIFSVSLNGEEIEVTVTKDGFTLCQK
jgi:trehalose/maltose hydrolase-like predicted phosphorylase